MEKKTMKAKTSFGVTLALLSIVNSFTIKAVKSPPSSTSQGVPPCPESSLGLTSTMESHSAMIVLAITACLLFLCTFGRKVGRIFYFTSKIPGPTLWKLLTVHAKPLLGTSTATYASKLCASYNFKPWGTWMMNLKYVVFVSDCETLSAVFKSKSTSDKPDFLYDVIGEYLGDSLLTMNGSGYSRHRKIFGLGLRKSLHENFLRRMPKTMSEFVKALSKKAATSKDEDLNPLVSWHVSDAILTSITSTYHESFPFIMQTFIDHMPYSMELRQTQAFNPLYYWLCLNFKKSVKHTDEQIFAFLEAIDKIIMDEKSRADDIDYAEDILQVVINSYLNMMKDEEVDDKELCAIGRTLFITSVETTAFVVNCVLLCLALHQDVQQRVYDEVNPVLETEKLVLSEDLERLKYTEMVIKETLRLFPAGPIQPKKVSEDSYFNGLFLPAESIVMVNIMAVHRNPEYFPDPLKFDPSRFSPEASKGRRPYTYIPFSAGYRSCPGQLHAFLIMKLMLCHVLKNFRILPGDELKSLDDIKVQMCVSMHLEKSPLRVVERRSEKV